MFEKLNDPAIFLTTVFTNEPGWLHLVGISKSYGIIDVPVKNDGTSKNDVIRDFVDRRLSSGQEHNIYYPVNLTVTPHNRRASNVDMSRLVYADLDTCDPTLLRVRPTVVIETSPHRFHALWKLDEPVDKFTSAKISRVIARVHKDDGIDQSGWDIAQILRVPGTLNYNRKDSITQKAAKVHVVDYRPTLYRPQDFEYYLKHPLAQGLDFITVDISTDGPCPEYDKMDLGEQCRIDVYVHQAVESEINKFGLFSELEPGERYTYHKKYKGKKTGTVTEFGWTWGCVWVSRGLIELALAPWNGFNLNEARSIFFDNAPRDKDFTFRELATIWEYSLNAVRDKKVPYRQFPEKVDEDNIVKMFRGFDLPDTWTIKNKINEAQNKINEAQNKINEAQNKINEGQNERTGTNQDRREEESDTAEDVRERLLKERWKAEAARIRALSGG